MSTILMSLHPHCLFDCIIAAAAHIKAVVTSQFLLHLCNTYCILTKAVLLHGCAPHRPVCRTALAAVPRLLFRHLLDVSLLLFCHDFVSVVSVAAYVLRIQVECIASVQLPLFLCINFAADGYVLSPYYSSNMARTCISTFAKMLQQILPYYWCVCCICVDRISTVGNVSQLRECT
jgi:hypothetical protein